MAEEEPQVWTSEAWFASLNTDSDPGGDFTLCLAQGGDNEDKDDIVENVEHQTSEDVTHWDNVIATHEHIPNIDMFSPYEVMSPA